MKDYSRKEDRIFSYVSLIPVLFVIYVIIGIPFIYSVYLSFTNKVVGRPESFIGIKNYLYIFDDPVYWQVLKNSFVYTFSSVSVKLIIGMIFALALNEKFIGRGIIRVLFLIPWSVSGMVAALDWKWLYNDTYGIFNVLLKNYGIIKNSIPWLGDRTMAMVSVIIVDIWRGIPFFLFSILGGLQTLDKEMYEAATIDGAGAVKRFFRLTIPSLIPVISIIAMLSSIWTFNSFDVVFVITQGNPAHASALISTYTYEVAFWQNRMGTSLSVGVSIIPILAVFIYFATKWMSKENDIGG
ncbi:MAG: sugar ABC transporter permease [Treponema sp.]|nr:sugar ABC transporter permease [Treponema sp.]